MGGYGSGTGGGAPVVVWSEENTQKLRKMAENGASAREIAFAIPGATRSAVIAKANRIGVRLDGAPRAGIKYSAPKPTPEEEAKARALYRQGLKVPSICTQLGGKYSIDTMSRILDPEYRDKRAKAAAARRALLPKPEKPKAPRPPRVRQPAKPTQEPMAAPPESLNLPYSALAIDGCSFAMNDGATKDLLFCGCKRQPGKAYCAYHARIASGGKPGKAPGAMPGR